MANIQDFVGLCHRGYMDGLQGLDPDPEATRLEEYETGWLYGLKDREAGKPVRDVLSDPLFKRGDKVRVQKGTLVWSTHPQTSGKYPTGRTYSVMLHDCPRGTPAYIDHREGFVPPKEGEALWAGAGGYWVYANPTDLTQAEG